MQKLERHYQVVTAVLHIRATPQSGHYRAALSHSARDGSFQWYMTDDSICPVNAKAADIEVLHTNVHLVGLSCSDHDRN